MTDTDNKPQADSTMSVPEGPCALERASSDSCLSSSSSEMTDDVSSPSSKRSKKRCLTLATECAKCTKKRSRRSEPSAWMMFLKKFQLANPGMSVGESQVQARKLYIPKNGRLKSFERVFREFWRAKNPSYKELHPADAGKGKMREDFLSKLV